MKRVRSSNGLFLAMLGVSVAAHAALAVVSAWFAPPRLPPPRSGKASVEVHMVLGAAPRAASQARPLAETDPALREVPPLPCEAAAQPRREARTKVAPPTAAPAAQEPTSAALAEGSVDASRARRPPSRRAARSEPSAVPVVSGESNALARASSRAEPPGDARAFEPPRVVEPPSDWDAAAEDAPAARPRPASASRSESNSAARLEPSARPTPVVDTLAAQAARDQAAAPDDPSRTRARPPESPPEQARRAPPRSARAALSRSAALASAAAEPPGDSPRDADARRDDGRYSPPSYATRVMPNYPRELLLAGIEGVVELSVRVSATGAPEEVSVFRGSGHGAFDDAARVTVLRHWRFVPARRWGLAVADRVIVPIRFRLADVGERR